MKQLASGLMLISLTACSGNNDAPAKPAARAESPSVSTVRVPLTEIKPVAATEKWAAKKQALKLLDVIQALDGSLDEPDAMHDVFRYGQNFYYPLEKELAGWPVDSAAREFYGDLAYCHETGRALSALGSRINQNFPQQFISEARERYQSALPKCERAIKNYS